MFKTVFIILLLAHILGVFYFQSQKLSEQKEKSLSKVLLHGIIYSLVCLIVIIPVINIWLIIAAAFISITHLIINLLKLMIVNRFNKVNKEITRIIYIIDQIMHIIFIFIASIFVALNSSSLNISPWIDNIFKVMEINKLQALSWLLLILIAWKPTNITIKKALSSYKPVENNEEETVINAGSFIGFLERMAILLFLSINQYSAIGLVLTAKSIARYNKISESKEFAEYYLLGTLLSTIFAIVSFIIIM